MPAKFKRIVIGIVGSRRRDSIDDRIAIEQTLLKIMEEGREYTFVSGGCPQGGDRFAEEIAKAWGMTITIHFPDWNRHKKRAGFIRNTFIAEDCDILIAAVHPDRTGGTEDTVKKARKLKKRIILV